MDEKEAVESYVTNAILHGKYTEEGNSKKTNIAHDNLIKNYMFLREQDACLKQLIPLLHHNDISVRCWAATHLLLSYESLAVPILEEIAKDNKHVLIAFDAKMVLSEWKANTLNLNYKVKG